MKQALEQAQNSGKLGEVPIGAVIVDSLSNKIIAKAYNQNILLNDPTAHAEILVIRQATKLLSSQRLVNCDLYVTLEPCPMCAQAISFARIRRLYFGAYDSKSGGVESGARIFNQTSCHYVPEIYGGILAEKSARLLKDFFAQLRI